MANSDLTIPEFDLHEDIESSELVKQARELERHPASSPEEALFVAQKTLDQIVAPTGLTVKEYIALAESDPKFDENYGEARFLYDLIQDLKSEVK